VYRSKYIGSVSSSLLKMIISFCDYNKLNIPEKCLRYLNQSNELNDLIERIPFPIWHEILMGVYEQCSTNGLGLEIAKHIQLSHAGILSYLAFSKPKLSKAIPDFITYQRLVYNFNCMNIHIDNNIIELSWGDSHGRPGLLVDETAIALFYNIVKLAIAPLKIQPKFVSFIYEKPKNIKIYENYFNCPVTFNSQSTVMAFSYSEIEKIHLNSSDEVLYKILKNQADFLINKLNEYDDFEQRLYAVVSYCLGKKTVSIDTVAEYMGVSGKELRKKLIEENISFHKVLNTTRESLAKKYLKDKYLSMSEISDLLGYAEQSVFQRAFKSWTGETPLKFRNNILNNKK
jgi:AraC-like DNA-binding protein